MADHLTFQHINTPLEATLTLDGGKHGFSHDLPVAALADQGFLTNVPNITDSRTLIEALRIVFSSVTFDTANHTLSFSEPVAPRSIFLGNDLLNKSRSLFGFLPAILSHGHTIVMEGLPEGCQMGDRPTDWYFDVLKQFGVKIDASSKEITLTWTERIPADITFEYPTMTGTVIAIAAASATDGTSTISNGSIEPSCIEEIACAQSMGVIFQGELPELTIVGNPTLKTVNWEILHDRVHAATFLTAGLLTRGKVTVKANRNIDIPEFVKFAQEAGADVIDNGNSITVGFPAQGYLNPVTLHTGSEPLYSSDWMAPTVLLLATRAKGTSIVTDNVFPERLQCIENLKKIGLTNVSVEQTSIEGRKALKATIEGDPNLVLDGGNVGSCSDLRGSTTLAMAALVSNSDIYIENGFHLERGYEDYNKVINMMYKQTLREKL